MVSLLGCVFLFARTQEMGAISPETIKQKRLEAANTYYKLRDFIDRHFTLESGAEPYHKTVNELNALITRYNTLLACRKCINAEIAAPNA